jgi:pyruvate dehydrogenase E1 component
VNKRIWPCWWLGSVRGHRVEALGVEHFGQIGTIPDLYRRDCIDANSIMTRPKP